MPYRVFISYSGEDSKRVAQVRKALTAVGVEVYTYEEDPRPGAQLAEKVKNEIKRTDAVVVLLSEKGSRSAWVHQEIGCAEMAGKLVVPLVESGTPESRLALLNGREYVPYDPDAPGMALSKLTGFLGAKAGAKLTGQAIAVLAGVLIALLIVYLATREE